MVIRKSKTPEYTEIVRCGACHSNSLKLVYDFGEVPLAGYFPKPEDALIPLLPMKLLQCLNCMLHQISPDISDRYLFEDYRYVSSIGMQSHFDGLASWFKQSQNPRIGSRIVEFGCNDGPLLSSLSKLGFNPVGIDPASNIVQIAKTKGLNVIDDSFGLEAVKRYPDLQNADFIFSSNSFAHITDVYEIAEAVSKALAPTGRFIVEVQSLVELLRTNAFDFIYHEHKYYYTIDSISNLLEQFGLSLIDCTALATHGGSYRLVFGKVPSQEVSEDLEKLRNEEVSFLRKKDIGLAIQKYLGELGKMDDYLDAAYRKGKRIIAFGASGRANMLLGNLPVTRKILKFVIDESPERIGRMMAQNGLPVVGFNDIDPKEYDVVVVLAWNYLREITAKWNNGKSLFVVPLPAYRIIQGQPHTD